jgi:hypothetical protein
MKVWEGLKAIYQYQPEVAIEIAHALILSHGEYRFRTNLSGSSFYDLCNYAIDWDSAHECGHVPHKTAKYLEFSGARLSWRNLLQDNARPHRISLMSGQQTEEVDESDECEW